MLSSCPLVFGGNHILVIFAQNICIRNFLFSGSKFKIVPALVDHPPFGCFATSQFSSQIILSETWKYVSHFQRRLLAFARSLIIKMNVYETACSKLDVIVLPPCYLEEIIFYSNLCPKFKHASEIVFFGLQMQTFPCPAWEGGGGDNPLQTLPPLGRFAPSQITFGDMEI